MITPKTSPSYSRAAPYLASARVKRVASLSNGTSRPRALQRSVRNGRPFKQILAGQEKSISTLSPGPEITSIQDIYSGHEQLDLDKLWLDIATLSNNKYLTEHEVSKFGAVPAEQIEGVLVIRKPAAVP